MASIGMDAFGISLIATEILVINLIFDIPSGIMADKWSRKYTLFLGAVCLGLATIIYAYSNSLLTYALGTVPYGLYLVLLSGTLGALTYDSLKELGKEEKYGQVQGMGYGLFCLGMFVSSFMSGFIADQASLQAPFLLSLIPISVAAVLIMSIKEPHFHKPDQPVSALSHFSGSLKVIGSSLPFLLIVIAGIALSSVNTLQTEYGSLYYIGLGLSTSLIGILYGVQSLARALGQVVAHKVSDWSLRLIPVAVLGLGLVSFIPRVGILPVFFLSVFLIAIVQNRIDVEVQKESPSHARATVGSLVNFLSNIILIPLGLLFGLIARSADIFHAYSLIFAVSLVALLAWGLRSLPIATRGGDNRSR